MPALRTKTELDAALAEWATYEDPTAWHRSGRGNLTRTWEDSRVTVFRRGNGHHWCLSHPKDGTRFSRDSFPSEKAAQRAAGTAVGVAYWYVPRKGVA